MSIDLLSMKHRAWVAVRGGAKYLAAVAKGDVADEKTIDERRAICRACPFSNVSLPPDATPEDAPSSWCGEPFVETKLTCGCLLSAKTSVRSEKCPQGKW